MTNSQRRPNTLLGCNVAQKSFTLEHASDQWLLQPGTSMLIEMVRKWDDSPLRTRQPSPQLIKAVYKVFTSRCINKRDP